MTDDLEVYCPECGKLFQGEGKMLSHIEKDHVSQKKNGKAIILSLDARYLGGHSSFPNQTNGNLSLYGEPISKVIFESEDYRFEIPLSSIIETKMAEGKEIDGMRAVLLGLASPVVGAASLIWRKTNKIFYIQFHEAQQTHTVIFDHSDSMDDFADAVKARILSTKNSVVSRDKIVEHPIHDEDPLHIIRVRYAKGEISKDQYEEMKKTLT